MFVSVNEYKGKKQYNQGFANRSSRLLMFLKIGVFKIFSIFTGKHARWSLKHTRFPVKCEIIKPFQSRVTFLYLLKTSENLRFSDIFRENRNVALCQNGFRTSFLRNMSGGCFCSKHIEERQKKHFFSASKHFYSHGHVIQTNLSSSRHCFLL